MGRTDALWPPPGPRSVVVPLAATGDAPPCASLVEQVCVLLSRGEITVVSCDLAAVTHADLRVIDRLSRLQLVVQRLGGCVRLRGVDESVRELIALAGLERVLADCGGQVELREQIGVQEVMDV